MTLVEAIIHAEDVANSECSECANEHKQLAGWLKELQAFKGNKIPMNNLFKFVLGEKVKVQVFNFITTGIVVERQLFEDKSHMLIRYKVQFSDKSIDTVAPWEHELTFVQTLPIGAMK